MNGTRHLIFCVADHFEPLGYKEYTLEESVYWLRRIWVRDYVRWFDAWRDADGCPPRHTFFYGADHYHPDCLNVLTELVATGYGEVEIHIHHRNDTQAGMRARLEDFRDCLHREHGCLGVDARTGRPGYGFVHGNWALCNARLDGDWCGVNEELSILADTGCYADFTFPSAPSPTQPRLVNAIYRAVDHPAGRGQDRGVPVRMVDGGRKTVDGGLWTEDGGRLTVDGGRGSEVGSPRSEVGGERPEDRVTAKLDVGYAARPHDGNADSRPQSTVHSPPSTVYSPPSPGLMLIQGPLGMNWGRRKWGILPRLENGGLEVADPPSADRVDLWVKTNVHVRGRPEWTFVKVHTHGGFTNVNRILFFGFGLKGVHEHLRRHYNDGEHWCLHYVTAREMYNIARAAEDGLTGNPGEYRDYEIKPPPVIGDR